MNNPLLPTERQSLVVCIFLDVDGVLNSAEMLMRIPGSFDRSDWVHMLDQAPCDRLERVLVATGAKIVLSSSWRHHWNAARMTVLLQRRGVKSADVIDVTPNSVLVNNCRRPKNRCIENLSSGGGFGVRGHEIQRWLTLHPEVARFAIVDDDSDMAHLSDRLVLTTWAEGMLDEHADRLIELLNDPERLAVPQIAVR